MIDEAKVLENIEAALTGAGLRLIEFSVGKTRGGLKVKAVVYSPEGTGTDECAKAYRLILPQIQLGYDAANPDMEISSPGIDRILRSGREWKAFVGQAIRILPKGESEWRQCTLLSYDGKSIEISDREGRKTIEISGIAKARLDSSHKGA